MNPEENREIPDRVDELQRQVRRLRTERLAMLAVIGCLIVADLASRLPLTVVPPLSAGERGARLVAEHSLTALRQMLRVQPAVDPKIVLEDEREAFGEPAPAPSLAKPAPTPALASSVPPATPQPGAHVESKSVPTATAPVSHKRDVVPATASGTVPHDSSKQINPHYHQRIATLALTPRSGAASLAAAGAAIGRDLDKTLTALPSDESYRTLALAEWPDFGASVSSAVVPASGSASEPTGILPGALTSAPTASATPDEAAAQASLSVPAVPVSLKALGYAQAADGSAQIVLSDGNAVYVVNEGQEFLDRFRVVSLSPEGVDIADRLTNRTVHLSFGL